MLHHPAESYRLNLFASWKGKWKEASMSLKWSSRSGCKIKIWSYKVCIVLSNKLVERIVTKICTLRCSSMFHVSCIYFTINMDFLEYRWCARNFDADISYINETSTIRTRPLARLGVPVKCPNQLHSKSSDIYKTYLVSFCGGRVQNRLVRSKV